MRFVLKTILAVSLLGVLWMYPLSAGAEDAQSPSLQTEAQPKLRAYLGARLSPEIPDLLRKHLQLEPEQGLLVENIFRDGPADKAGLDKDDILISLDGKPLKNPREFFRSLHAFTIGQTFSVELIHLGQRKQAHITLEAMKADYRWDRSGWKYPIEPDESVVIRPGRMFQMRPGEKEWIEIPIDPLKNPGLEPPKLTAQYHFLHNDGQKEFTIVIQGNPSEAAASITVKTPDKEYFTTADQIDMLPEEYRQTVRSDIEKAKQSYESGRNLRIPSRMDFSKLQEFFAEGGRPSRQESRGDDSDNAESRGTESRSAEQRLDALNKQIQRLEERQKALDAYLREKLEQK